MTRRASAVACLVLVGCSAGSPAATPTSVPTESVATTEIAASTTSQAPVASTTTSTSTSTTTTLVERNVTEVIGTSVEGRPIEVIHVDPASVLPGSVPVLVVGVIHGDENDGLPILDDLASGPAPSGVDLWLMPAMNPDGLAADARHNARGVDLNRNFPHDWTAIAAPGTGSTAEPARRANPRPRRSSPSSNDSNRP